MHGVSILGATGSIGVSTLDVVARHPQQYRVVALTARQNEELLYQQCLRFNPELAVMVDPDAAERLRARLKVERPEIRVLAGEAGLCAAATHPEATSIMAAIVGAAGLVPTLAAVKAGKRVLLANKEALVMSGQLFMDAVHAHGATLLPIDSEHNAIFQCMPGDFSRGLDAVGVRRVLLTGSGGPFRTLPLEQLASVTPEQACKHPNWVMGRKISVDSATMMNKGLEVIEARWLFDAEPSRITVVVHPQSVIHSMVEYVDGSVLAQLGQPDMRTPIAHALAWPARMSSGVSPLDLIATGRLDFEAPDFARFPCLRLAYEALATGGTAMAVLNAANEVAVEAFLAGQIPFTAIARVNEATLAACELTPADSLERVVAADAAARREAGRQLAPWLYKR